MGYQSRLLLDLNRMFVYFSYRLTWVEISGTVYKLRGVVVLGMDLVPKFGLITDILVFDTDIYYLVCEVLFTVLYSHHYHSYQVYKQSPIVYVCCKQCNLHDHTVLSAYSIPTQPSYLFVPLKYQLIEN